MSVEKAKKWLSERGMEDHISVHDVSTDTVAHAAAVIGVSEGEIAKTLSFIVDGKPLLVVAAGDAKVSNGKFKNRFGKKGSMIPRESVEELVGHEPGGVCPFGVNEGVPVYLDVSLKAYRSVHAACGSEWATVELTPSELESFFGADSWVDVFKLPSSEEQSPRP